MQARRIRGIALLAAAVAALGCAAPAFDPVAMDAPPGDPPAQTQDLQFWSEGAHLNALLLLAADAGPHPTAVLLHGFPGNERNLDLAQALRRAGWNAVYFSYRGAWGSGGEFSFGNALEDVAAVVASLRAPAFAREHRVDPERIVLIGHSMGGALSLLSAAKLDGVRCTASLAGANLGAFGGLEHATAEAREQLAATFQTWGEGRIASFSGAALLTEFIGHQSEFASERYAAALARKPVLLVAGANDEVTPPALHHAPLVAAIRAQGGGLLRETTLAGDHSFSASRIALTRVVLAWLDGDCLRTRSGS
ncbi:MAG TPA: alpha/beta fold hydrolase [Myxococcota bacterium]